MHSLASIDLNLVVALHALLEEQSVTGAARRVGLSQPAMSHALARLRSHFGDPLLVRSGRRMTPTPVALQLLERVRPAVDVLEALLDPAAPPDLATTVRLVTDDWIGTTWLPAVLAKLRRAAPSIEVDVLARGRPGRKALLRQGRVDLALGAFSGAGMDLHRHPLFREPWVCVRRVPGALTVDDWATLPHVVVSPTRGRRGDVDTALEAVGRSRRVPVAVPHFTTALAIVASSDLVLTTPASVASTHADALGLHVSAPPLTMPPIEVSMLWHPRTAHDPTQRWLRDQLLELSAVAHPPTAATTASRSQA